MDIQNRQEPLIATDSDLGQSKFTSTRLAGASFTDVSLEGARFADVDLHGASFENVTLAGATFSDVDLGGATLEHARCDGLRIDGVAVDKLLAACRVRAGAVLFCRDLTRMQAFYEAVAGLVLERRDAEHVVLASAIFELVLHRAQGHAGPVARGLDRRTDAAIKLVLPVADLGRARLVARARGGGMFPPEREWDTPQARICDGNDPEGNVVQFRQAR